MKKIVIIATIIIFGSLEQTCFAASENNLPENFAINEVDNNEEDLNMQSGRLGVNDFVNNSKKFTNDIDVGKIFKEGLTGKVNNNNFFKLIAKALGGSAKASILSLSGIIVIVILNSLLKALCENLGNESVAQVAYFSQYVLLVTLVIKNYTDAISQVKASLQDLTAFSAMMIPVLSSLVIASGHMATSSALEPILLTLITFTSKFLSDVVIPILLVAVALAVISKISDKVQIGKLSKFMNKSSVWILTTVLGLFLGIASLEGGLTSNIDNVTKKAGRSIIAATVPVVGRILGDSIDTIVGYNNIIKNATGMVGIIVVVAICVKPIANLILLTAVYYLSAALCEPIADKQIVELLDQIAASFKVLLAIMLALCVMFVVGVAIMIKVSG